MSNSASVITALGTLFTTNPTGATSVFNALGHQNGQASTMVMALLSMATPDNIGDIAQKIAGVPGVGNLNVLPLVEQLIGVKDPAQFSKGVLAVETSLTTNHTSGFGGVLSGLFGAVKHKPAAPAA
jgi:hypothetical protein